MLKSCGKERESRVQIVKDKDNNQASESSLNHHHQIPLLLTDLLSVWEAFTIVIEWPNELANYCVLWILYLKRGKDISVTYVGGFARCSAGGRCGRVSVARQPLLPIVAVKVAGQLGVSRRPVLGGRTHRWRGWRHCGGKGYKLRNTSTKHVGSASNCESTVSMSFTRCGI